YVSNRLQFVPKLLVSQRLCIETTGNHEYDEWCGYDNERNYFPFVRLEKLFSPRNVRWRIEATFFTGDCIVASRESCGPAAKMTPSNGCLIQST
ncbi:unnamed protein product, partial [Porites lobata]